jgi:DHA1 family multidrug resistance protein-like MFS transporter
VASAGNAMVASIAPRDRIGYAMGVLQTASWSGVAVGPIVGGILADTFGYRMAFTVTGVLLMIGGFIVTLGIKEKFTPVTRTKGQGGILAGWKRILARPGISDTFMARFTSNLARGLLVPILPLFIPIVLHGQGAIGTFTGLVIGVSSATGTIAAIVLGNLGDRTGHRRILIISALVAAASYIPMAFVTEGWQLLLLNALSGIATGGLMPAPSALLVRYTAEEEVGSAFGLDNSVMSAARAAAPLLAVGTVSLLGYQAVFFLGALIFLITLAITIWKLPEPDQQRRPRELQRDSPA